MLEAAECFVVCLLVQLTHATGNGASLDVDGHELIFSAKPEKNLLGMPLLWSALSKFFILSGRKLSTV